MSDALEAAVEVWKLVPPRQRNALILLAVSIPLSFVSIWQGFGGDTPLLLAGLATLAVAAISVSIVGFGLLVLLWRLVRFLVTLPFRLLGRRRVERATDPRTPDAASESRPAATGFDGFSLLLFGWFALTLLQVVLLLGAE